ncbi:MAG: 4Fe-4S dicluster domain-containing protein [Bacteroidales bacterium]
MSSMHHHAHGEGGYCVCPQCDFYTEHMSGVPCRTLTCPDCGVSLIRGEVHLADEKESQGLPFHRVQPREKVKVPFPKVIVDKCTACGICINICPTGTIVWIEGKAFVEEAGCRNCRICIARCPEKAIIL